jgi:hypothetical protein
MVTLWFSDRVRIILTNMGTNGNYTYRRYGAQ